MKKILIAAISLFAVVSCNTLSESSTAATSAQESKSEISEFPFAYIDVDKALSESKIYKLEGAPLQSRIEAAQRDWAQKEERFQIEVAKLTERYQNGLITTTNAQMEQQSIDQRVAAYQAATEKQAAQLDEENAVFTRRTQVLMREAVSEVNKDGRYKMIFNATSLINADTLLNISDLVRAELDRLYESEKSK